MGPNDYFVDLFDYIVVFVDVVVGGGDFAGFVVVAAVVSAVAGIEFLRHNLSLDYVDKQLLASRCVTKAAIAGHDGNLWAKSEGFEVTKEELAKLVQCFEKQDILTSTDVTLAGSRYIYLSGTDRVV
ncbi:hypothetical protein FQA39_LY01502 [Lamprigera yunnana]|nr:hypothetical protein FQA39_LY01502 [Lamprigera yunnana]